MSQNLILYGADPEEVERFRVMIDARTRHADLWPLVRKLGSASALAKQCGISPSEIGLWINLKSYPKDTDRTKAVLDNLYLLTGKSFEEMWPPALIEAIRGGHAASRRDIEIQTSVEQIALNARDRLSLPSPPQIMEREEEEEIKRERLQEAMESLRPREKLVLESRLIEGLSLREVSLTIKVTKERVRGIQARAEEKIRDWYKRRGWESPLED